MLEENSGALRTVAWKEICPWLSIFRSFRLAIGLKVLVFGAMGMFLTLCGWAVLSWLFSVDAEWMRPGDGCPVVAVNDAVPNQPALPVAPNPIEADQLAPSSWQALDPFFGVWGQLSRPLWDARGFDLGLSKLACLVLCGLWSLGIWAFFGGAITRIVAVGLASGEGVGWGAAIRFAGSKWLAYFAAPLFPLIGILLVVVPVCLLGLLVRLDIGLLLASLVWPLLLIGGFVITLLLLGLIFGWPLMWGTISAEGTDSFDALSRSYAYVYQRPLHLLFYAVVAAAFGWLGWLLVSNFVAAIVASTYWAVSWGAGADRVAAVNDQTLTGIGSAGVAVISFWVSCLKLLAVGFIYSYFWTASTSIYFLLRRNVDATELDEVFLDEDQGEEAGGLPSLATDEAGAPVVADDLPAEVPEPEAEPPEEE